MASSTRPAIPYVNRPLPCEPRKGLDVPTKTPAETGSVRRREAELMLINPRNVAVLAQGVVATFPRRDMFAVFTMTSLGRAFQLPQVQHGVRRKAGGVPVRA